MSGDLDRSRWEPVHFGEVVTLVKGSSIPTPEESRRYIGLEHMPIDGTVTITRYGSETDLVVPKTLVRKGDVLFARRNTHLRRVAVAPHDGHYSPDGYAFRGSDRLLHDFLPWLVASSGFMNYAIANSAGTHSKRVRWEQLGRFEFRLPPLDEQKRIADLLWAVEAHRRAVLELRAAGRACLWRLVRHRLASIASMIRLCEVATTRSGPSFDASEMHDRAVEGSVPVIGIPNTKSDGTIDLADVGHVTGLPDGVGRVDDRSLILIRTNGSRERIGNVYLPPAEAHGHAVSAFQFLMQANDSRDRDYLFWVLNDRAMQDRMSDNASGSVGLGNLAVRWLNAQEVPWPAEGDDRRALVEEFRKFEAAGVAVGSQLRSLEVLRGAISTAIFGGA